MREKGGAISPMKVLECGSALPAQWTRSLLAGRQSLKLGVATACDHEDYGLVGELQLGAADLAKAGDKVTVTIQAYLDEWLHVSARGDDGKLLAEDWLPLAWRDGRDAASAPAGMAKDSVD